MLHINCNYFSETGPRDKNEDFIANYENKSIFIVGDGMGS